MRCLLLLLLLQIDVHAQWRPINVSSGDIGGITENFRRASIYSNRKLDKFSNEIVYGTVTFKNPIKSSDSTYAILNATQSFTGLNTGRGMNTPGDFKWKISQSSSCGSGWLRADGSSKSTTTYSALFAEIGYMFGGTTDFLLPDMNNGEFVRALSTGTAGGNLTSNFGIKQQDAYEDHVHSVSGVVYDAGGSNSYAGGGRGEFRNINTGTGSIGAGTETRPINYAMIPCIYSGVP